MSETQLLTKKPPRPVFDRGPRPFMRGRLHTAAAWYFGGMGTALTIVAVSKFGLSWMSIATALYALCLAGMLTVSALYHRVPWRSATAVNSWRRADHAMIAVFIAGTYGPVTVAAFGAQWFTGWAWFDTGGLWILAVCWLAAACAVMLNLVWIDHPRWLDATTYLVLGWLVAVGAAGYYQQLGLAVSLLILIGGIVYSVGAIIYAKQWPNPSPQWFGFHEVFHAATILAALLHHIAIWILVLR